MKKNQRIVVGITGASGSVYAVRLLEVLHQAGVEIHLVVTHSGENVLQHECNLQLNKLLAYAHTLYNVDNIGAAIGILKTI